MRHTLCVIVCYVLGHITVDRKAANCIIRPWLNKDTDYVCLRCRKQFKSLSRMIAENFFRKSPSQEALEKGNET